MGAKWFGAAVKRKEDPALLAGNGRFIDDVRLPGNTLCGPCAQATDFEEELDRSPKNGMIS
jgi:hypothetical protein